MPEVTFYVLPSRSQQERLAFACKLIEKVYRSGHSCFVLTDTDRQSSQLDDFLWSFRPGSFVPHQIYRDEAPPYPQTVLIGNTDIPEYWQQVVINLSSATPKQFDQCKRILEILDNSEETKQAGRDRYRFYRQAGLDIATHNL